MALVSPGGRMNNPDANHVYALKTDSVSANELEEVLGFADELRINLT